MKCSDLPFKRINLIVRLSRVWRLLIIQARDDMVL